jgi:ATP-dependent Clp protease protease subunit
MSLLNLPEARNRNLYLAKQVNQDSINDITKAIIEINESDEQLVKIYNAYDLQYNPKPIKLYIDSYGGAVYQCFGLLGVMRSSKVPVHTIVTGCAMSCGFLISITGHKRFGYPKSTYLYHQVSGGVIGKAKDMEEEVIEVKRLQKMIEDHTLEFTKIPVSQLEKIYKRKIDWSIDSKKAIKLGIIDEVI